MTLIAHGILALDKVMADLEERIFPKSKVASRHVNRAKQRLRDIQLAEVKIAKLNLINRILNDGYPIHRKRNNPLVLEKMLVGNVAVVVLSPLLGGVKLLELYFTKREAKKEAKALAEKAKKAAQSKIESNAAAIRAQKEQERAEESAEADEETEIETFENIIKTSSAVAIRVADATKDKSAMVKGLTNSTGKIVMLDQDHIIFLYNFTTNPDVVSAGKSEASVFFMNPKTGNYEQIAKISSKRGVQRLFRALKNKEMEIEQAEAKHANAQIMQAQMLGK